MAQTAVLPPARGYASGEILWSDEFDGAGELWDYAADVAVSPDGSKVYVTGSSWSGPSVEDFVTIAYDAATGDRIWKARFNGARNWSDVPAAVDVSPDGSKVFVTGRTWAGSSGDDYATVAYDAITGGKLWFVQYNGPGNGSDDARAIGVSPDGSKVFVTGNSYSGDPTYDDIATFAYDASTGALVWEARYTGPEDNSYGYPTALAVAQDGSGVFVTGSVYTATTANDYATVGYDAETGTQRWAALHDGLAHYYDSATAIAVSPDASRVFVTGHDIHHFSTGDDWATIAYDAATGNELWHARLDSPIHGYDDPYALAVSLDGSVLYVAGNSYADWATVAYDTVTGAVHWGSRFSSPGNAGDAPLALGVSGDGTRVYVAGFGGTRTGQYEATVAYDGASGATLWVERPHEKGSSSAASLAVSPTGSAVYVTGWAQTTYDGRTDFATIAYAG